MQGQSTVITRNAWKVRKGEGEGGIREKEGRPDEGTEGRAEGQVDGDGRRARKYGGRQESRGKGGWPESRETH